MKSNQHHEPGLNKEYYEVFNKNKGIRYGITSLNDKKKIEEKYPEKYVFKKSDYIDLEKLEERSKVYLSLTFHEKLMAVLVVILIISIVFHIT